MAKKNIYLVQANAVYGESVKNTYIPYAAGCIAAYAFEDGRIKEEYSLGKLIYTRQNVKSCAAGLSKPFLVGFSCSVWNNEYNKALAREIKRLYPGCLIVFGGHQLPPDSKKAFEQYPDCDIIIHGGGEEAFKELLLQLSGDKKLGCVKNIAYRLPDGEIARTPRENPRTPDYPSPYLSGIFDSILDDGYVFSAIIETNRGCPNSCAFCDWGALKSKVRLFDIEKVFQELLWLSEHKIEYVYCADANFGLFERDMRITDYLTALKQKTGYPKKFKVNFTKNRYEFVSEISKKLSSADMGKSQTLSFQSVDEKVLEIIGRKNIGLEHFKRLLQMYSEAGISTYSELILGLPGESYESFTKGLCDLIENGQHKSVNIYPCELLPNSQLGSEEYIKKYEIKTCKLPFLQYHCKKEDEKDEITEYSYLITSTCSMSERQWCDSYFFAVAVQSFHLLGISREAAILLREIYDISYKSFYTSLISFALSGKNACLYKIFSYMKEHIRGIARAENPICLYDSRFGAVSYEPDEYMFLSAVYESDLLFEALKEFISSTIRVSGELAGELIRFEKALLNRPGLAEFEESFSYDFPEFFKSLEHKGEAKLIKRDIRLRFFPVCPAKDFSEYARECVWYGRRNEGMKNSAEYL